MVDALVGLFGCLWLGGYIECAMRLLRETDSVEIAGAFVLAFDEGEDMVEKAGKQSFHARSISR